MGYVHCILCLHAYLDDTRAHNILNDDQTEFNKEWDIKKTKIDDFVYVIAKNEIRKSIV